MIYSKYLSKAISIIFLFVIAGFTQGNIKGIVVDAYYSEPLPGANVFIQGTSLGAATDINGLYYITGIPVGSYVLEVVYIGYQSKQVPVEITDGETLTFNIEVEADVIEGETITITAQAEGQIAAINQQINSNTIVNVISEEKIKELPDANAAEAIGRLPGISITRTGGEANKVILRGLQDKFTAIQIDGVRIPATDANSRGIDLSMISQSALAGIEVAKAVTPDKDGDALAGAIDMVSKKAPDERQFRTNIKGNYNDLTEATNQYDLSFHYGERFFDNILGVQVAGNLEQKVRSSERLDVSHRLLDGTYNDYQIQNLTLEFTDEIRTRNGMSVLLDINTPDDGTIRINNVFNGTIRDYLTHSRDYPDIDAVEHDFRQREKDINTWSSSISGDNHLLGVDLNWGLSFAESKAETPFDYQMTFYAADFNEGMDTPNMPYPNLFDYKEAPQKIIPIATNRFDQAPQAWGYYRDQDNYEKERTAFFNISKDYNILDNISGQIKAGAKYKVKDRSNKSNEKYTPYHLDKWKEYEYVISGGDTIIRPKDFSGTYFEDWFNNRQSGFINLDQFFTKAKTRNVYGDYELTPLIDKKRLKQWQKLNKYGIVETGFNPNSTGEEKEVWSNELASADNYDITESVSAFYIMNTLKIGQQLTFISGLRTEHEYNDYQGVYMKGSSGGYPVPEGLLNDTTSSAQQTVYLPNFHLAYSPTDYLKIRLATYKALARPDFNMRLDRWLAGRTAVTTDFVTYVGNINLKTAEAWNYEINTSFFGNNIGLISMSAFYKEIDNMYHNLNNYGTSGDSVLIDFGINWKSGQGNRSYDISLPYNSKKPTKVWGFEFEHQINMHFLPGYLKNIVLSYNASVIRSETYRFTPRLDSIWVPLPPPFDPSLGAWQVKNKLVEVKTKLEAQPEFFGNIVLGYDLAGFSGRISLYHQAEYDDSYSADQYNIKMELTRLDVTLKQRLTDNFSVFLNLNNITNVEDGNYTYENKIRRFDKSEKYGMTIDFGVLANF